MMSNKIKTYLTAALGTIFLVGFMSTAQAGVGPAEKKAIKVAVQKACTDVCAKACNKACYPGTTSNCALSGVKGNNTGNFIVKATCTCAANNQGCTHDVSETIKISGRSSHHIDDLKAVEKGFPAVKK